MRCCSLSYSEQLQRLSPRPCSASQIMCPANESPDGLSFLRGMWFREQSVDWIPLPLSVLARLGLVVLLMFRLLST